MSRRTSYGYSSYGSHSYKSGSYGRNKRRKNDNKKKIILLTVLLVLILAVAAAGVWLLLTAGGNIFGASEDEESSIQESSAASAVEESSEDESSDESEAESSDSAVGEISFNPDAVGYFDENVFIYDGQGYEMFYGTETTAKSYAAIVSSIKEALGGDVNVYNMVVPTHAEYGLPDEYLDTANDQYENIQTVYSSYTADVIAIDVYEALDSHKGEYIYFKTDNNWTALGAYYAYQCFCEEADITAFDINNASIGSISDFGGALLAATKTDSNPDGNEDLLSNLDTVNYYTIPGDYSCYLLENGTDEEREVTLIASFASGSNSYSAFIWGDNPYMRIETDNKNGKKLCIIKDSYGCALAPYTVTNYEEIFIVDPRYYSGNIIEYIQENEYTDVLVINSIMTANTEVRQSELKSIIE